MITPSQPHSLRIFALALFLLVTDAQAMENPPLAMGQMVYVPVYSSVLYGNVNERGQAKEILLSAMLSVRNTDPVHGMTIQSVTYYDTHGTRLREYLNQPKALKPMGSADFFVEYRERSGGTGANFVVTWRAERPINQPIMETVHLFSWGAQSQSFISRGQVIRPAQENESPIKQP
ncbi:DUF3124 domain-containing protein [Candidatus Magnetaquicoccus inordinatus]|uniref:DUF3124 domain-containing protein n=1 Tax=Candidatus Magnetaquicoccus inordinatus TaxID=2496818 RepID=UPI00102AA5D6|nr:DUF3124 domain-containing protein [Candidatus Magnetaquicoccus inordinatus]